MKIIMMIVYYCEGMRLKKFVKEKEKKVMKREKEKEDVIN